MSGSIELRTQVTTLSILEGNILLSVLMREVREGLAYWSLINWLVNPLLIDDWFIHNQYSFADVVDWWPAIYSLHCWPNLSRADNISNFLDYILGWGEKKDYCSDLAWDDLITLQVQVDKENSMELDSVHYLYNYYMVCALLFHTHHVTVMCDICHMTISCTPSLCSKSKWGFHLGFQPNLNPLLILSGVNTVLSVRSLCSLPPTVCVSITVSSLVCALQYAILPSSNSVVCSVQSK